MTSGREVLEKWKALESVEIYPSRYPTMNIGRFGSGALSGRRGIGGMTCVGW